MKEETKDNFLISVIVVTYNSSTFVEETLNSVLNQSYPNIELIITDDKSTDKTVQICKEWLDRNQQRFVRVELVQTNQNTGIPGNCNRGAKKARGEWLRFIAGDDIFSEKAVENGVKFIGKNENVSVFSSNVARYNTTFDDADFIEIRNDSELEFYKFNASQQYESLLKANRIHAEGIFIKNSLFKEFDGYDERIRYIEDHPMWLKLTKGGVKIFYMNELSAKYRVHDASITYSKESEERLFGNFYLKIRKFQKLYIYPNVGFWKKIILDYDFYRHSLMDKLGLNRNTKFSKALYIFSEKISPTK